MAKINDTNTFPITSPASGDMLLGTDVSDTSNDANGETVNISVGSIWDGLAQGLYGAPGVQAEGLGLFLGSGDESNVLTVTDLDSVGWIVFGAIASASGDPETTTVQIRFSSNNGSSYGSYQDVFSFRSENNTSGFGSIIGAISLVNGFAFLGTSEPDPQTRVSGPAANPLTVPADCNALQIRQELTGGNRSSDFAVFGLSKRTA